MNKNNLWKPILFLICLIAFCALVSRIWSGSETLSEYAEENPELAYSQPEDTSPVSDETVSGDSASAKTISVSDGNLEHSSSNTSSVQPSGHTNDIEDPSLAEKENEMKKDSRQTEHPDRVEYKPSFYYEPLSDSVKERITGISYPEDCPLPYDELRYVSVMYYNFKGNARTGELICNKAIAQDLVEIFYELYQSEYQIEQIHLIDEYGGDDTLSMKDNNTSCFNYRVVDGTTNLSKHAYGLAIDINPFFNPYVKFNGDGTTYISPEGSESYADRSKPFAYKIDEDDLCYKLFTEHGFIWGGHWNSCKDYQHFQKTIPQDEEQ